VELNGSKPRLRGGLGRKSPGVINRKPGGKKGLQLISNPFLLGGTAGPLMGQEAISLKKKKGGFKGEVEKPKPHPARLSIGKGTTFVWKR